MAKRIQHIQDPNGENIYDSVFTYRNQPNGPVGVPETRVSDLKNGANKSQVVVDTTTYGVVSKKNGKSSDASFNHPPAAEKRSPMKGPLAPPPQDFMKNLHRVMEKKWKVAQTLSQDLSQFELEYLKGFGESKAESANHETNYAILGFNKNPVNNGHHENDVTNSNNHEEDDHVPDPPPPPPPLNSIAPMTAAVKLQQDHQQQLKNCIANNQNNYYPPPNQSDNSNGFYDVLPVHVRPYRPSNDANNGATNGSNNGMMVQQSMNPHPQQLQYPPMNPNSGMMFSPFNGAGVPMVQQPYRRSSNHQNVAMNMAKAPPSATQKK